MMVQTEALNRALLLEREEQIRRAQLRAQARLVRRKRLAETRAGLIRRMLLSLL